MRLLCLIIYFLVTSTLAAQNQKTVLDGLIERMVACGRVEDEYAGMKESQQYLRFDSLKAMASNNQLMVLLDHKSAVVRSYAAMALVDRDYTGVTEVFKRFMSSDEQVKTVSGCLVSRETLSQQLYYRIFDSHFYRNREKRSDILEAQLRQINDLVLRRDTVDYMLFKALNSNNGRESNYKVVKSWALRDSIPEALVGLAEFQKEEDIDTLISLGPIAYEAITYFLHDRFRSPLEEAPVSVLGGHYFNAVLSFQDEWSLDLITEKYSLLKESSNTSAIYQLVNALEGYYGPLYKDLAQQIFEEQAIITPKLVRILMKEAPDRKAMSRSFQKAFLSGKQVNVLIDMFNPLNDKPLGEILNYMNVLPKKELEAICINQIMQTDFLNLEIYTDFIRKERLKGTAEALIEKLNTSDHAFDIYHLTQTLLSFKKADVTKRTISYLEACRSHWDWDNWSMSFQELFKKYKVQVN